MYLCSSKAVGRSAADAFLMNTEEESPGSTEHSTTENGSSPRGLSNAEENNRLPGGKGEKVGQEPTSGVATLRLCILEAASSCIVALEGSSPKLQGRTLEANGDIGRR